MKGNTLKSVWTLTIAVLVLSVLYTSYKTLIRKDFIIVEEEITEEEII